MIAVDTNILVYAHRADSEWHDRAAICLRELAEGRAPCAIPWPCVHEFLAIVTHRRIYDPPTPVAAALDQVDAWLESPSLVLLMEAGDYGAVPIVLSDGHKAHQFVARTKAQRCSPEVALGQRCMSGTSCARHGLVIAINLFYNYFGSVNFPVMEMFRYYM